MKRVIRVQSFPKKSPRWAASAQPYWKWLALLVLAICIEIATNPAAPRPLEVVLDPVFSSQSPPPFLMALLGGAMDRHSILNRAVAATVIIALLQFIGACVGASYSASIGQRIAHDLRLSVYTHLHRLAMSDYDRQRIGPIVSTITDDINAVQVFASTSLLDILVDGLTILGMLVFMFSPIWRITLVARALTPLLAFFFYRLRFVVKTATQDVRLRQSELVSIVQEALGAIRVVKAFSQGRFERGRLEAKSLES